MRSKAAAAIPSGRAPRCNLPAGRIEAPPRRPPGDLLASRARAPPAPPAPQTGHGPDGRVAREGRDSGQLPAGPARRASGARGTGRLGGPGLARVQESTRGHGMVAWNWARVRPTIDARSGAGIVPLRENRLFILVNPN